MITLRIWGDYALFSRPESKPDRYSYPVPTPTAMRGVLESIHWKPAFQWVVDRIHVLRPISYMTITTNEISQTGAGLPTVWRAAARNKPLYQYAGECRQQRTSTVLCNVGYVIEAHIQLTATAGSDTIGKHLDIFRRRARKGACFQHPYMGCREFPAHFELLEDKSDIPVSDLADDEPQDLGYMLYARGYKRGEHLSYYHPWLEHGIIDVAKWSRNNTLCI